MSDLKPSFPSDPDVLAVFRQELARVAAVPGLAAAPALWPRFAGYYHRLSRLPRRVRRTLQRQWRRSLGGLALLLALGQAPALAATINVGGACSLIDAITAANNGGSAGGCAPGDSGADTIVLPANSIHTLTAVNNTADGSPNGLPPITSTITIAGNGSTITRDPAAPDFRILLVRSGDLTLRETTVSGGRTIQFRDGGGVANDGVLSLVNSNVINNYSPDGGGGLHNNFGATLGLTNSTVSGNLAAFSGGGIRNRNILTVTNSTVSGNSATQDGGGVISGGTLTLLNSTVSANTASQFGGGLRISSGTAIVTNSTVSGNFARRNGGGLNNTGTVTLTTSTVSGNSTGENGGGVRNSSTLTLNETLISGNTASSQGPELYHAGGTVNANRSNLFGYGGDPRVTNFTPGGNDLVPDEALTAILDTALRSNGGATTTHALVAGSPAIDRGGNCLPATDQRGVARLDEDGDGFKDCDIGAFEVEVIPPQQQANLSITKADSPDPVFEGQQLTYTVTVRNNGPDGATGVTVTDPVPGGVFLASATPSQGGCSGTATVTCALGSLANGASATVTIVVIPTLAGALSNTASVTGSPSDPDPGDNSATTTTAVLPIPEIRADLAVTQTDVPDPGAIAEPLVYTLTVTNNGPSAATGVQITDNLPVGVVLTTPPIPSQGGTCVGTGPVVCHLGTLASGASATVTINALPTQAGTVSNAASVVGIEPDITPGNNSASSTTTINERAVVPPTQGSCNRTACGVQLTCTLGASCADRRVTLFVPGRTVQLSEGALARASKRIKFAFGVANIPPGETRPVRLRLTNRGKTIISTLKKRIKAVMEIRNSAGTAVSSTPIRIRFR